MELSLTSAYPEYDGGTIRAAEKIAMRNFVLKHKGYLTGRILDFGAGRQPYRDLVSGEYTPYNPDLPSTPSGSTVDSDNSVLSLSYDTVLCTCVIQYVPGLRETLSLFRSQLSAYSGHLLLIYPTTWPEVESTDLWRITKAGMEYLLDSTGFTVLDHQLLYSIRLSDFILPIKYGVLAKVPDPVSTESIVASALPYTKTDADHLESLIQSTRKIISQGIPGAFVECGVWKGGSVLAIVKTLLSLGVQDRDVYLYDTYSGMPLPSANDIDEHGTPALPTFLSTRTGPDSSSWCAVAEEEVLTLIRSTGYPMDRVHSVIGKVEDTLPFESPSSISLLRLDTDWYSSTKHELETLYPLLSPGGVLIVDDYGHWQGARKATDEYFSPCPIHLEPCGHSVVTGVKQ